MKLSEHPEYQTAVTAGLESKFKEARAAYLQLIAIAERENDIPAHSYLLQCLGDIEARDGNRRIGWRMHRQAIEYSPNIPFVLIMYAKSLANHFDRKKLAVEMLDQAEQLLDSHEWNKRMTTSRRNLTPIRSRMRGSKSQDNNTMHAKPDLRV